MKILTTILATLLAAVLLMQSTVRAEAQRPNVLFITSDDLGLQLGCYGDTVIETPHLDALAASGVQFDVAYVAQASCSPSRSAMFTGLYPHANGQYGLTAVPGAALHPHLTDATLPNILKRAGYRTGIIGKLHVAPEKSFKFDYHGGGAHGCLECEAYRRTCLQVPHPVQRPTLLPDGQLH